MLSFRERAYQIIFGTDTKAGRLFDVVLLWFILLSVLIVMLESIPEWGTRWKYEFGIIEWVLTIVFSLEYLVRIWCSPAPARYIFSFWGLIDFLSVIPTYLSLLISGSHYFVVVRIFRLLRVFRILKLVRYHSESRALVSALKASWHKISIFLFTVLAIVIFLGTLMYVVEGGQRGFTSIPQSIYWAIVTVTTVGYGDMVPQTIVGKFISSFAMIIGYAIIAVPTGIVTVAMANQRQEAKSCKVCNTKMSVEANYCSACGEVLD